MPPKRCIYKCTFDGCHEPAFNGEWRSKCLKRHEARCRFNPANAGNVVNIVINNAPAAPPPTPESPHEDDAPAIPIMPVLKHSFIYIRTAVPGATDHASSDRRMDASVIKFGICKSLEDRHASYGRDGGFFRFWFTCSGRDQAVTLENTIKGMFGNCLKHGHEYLDVRKVASKLGMPDAEPDTVAQKVFAIIVHTAKMMGYGMANDFGAQATLEERDGRWTAAFDVLDEDDIAAFHGPELQPPPLG